MKPASLAAQLQQCTGCNACLPVCPAFRHNEPAQFTPAGIMAILRYCAENGELPDPGIFQHCSLCGKCEKACPARLPLTRLFYEGRQGASKIPFGKKFLETARHGVAANLLAPFFNGRKANKGRLAKLPFIHRGSKSPKNQRAVLFFPGCEIREGMPQLARNAALAMEKSGFSVISPISLKCCGINQPAPIALNWIRKNLRIMAKSDFEWLVTACPRCMQAIIKLWPFFPGLPERERQMARHLAEKTRHILSFLAEHGAAPSTLPDNLQTIWHNSCVLAEEENETAKKLFGGKTDLKTSSVCCGAECGSSCLRQGEKSREIRPEAEKDWPAAYANQSLKEKLTLDCENRIRSLKTDLVLTACPKCATHISKSAKNNFTGQKVRAAHFLEFFGKP